MSKILMIDDDLDDQYFYKDFFLSISSELDFDCVSNVEELRLKYMESKVEEKCPNLVILDLNLPKVSGKEIFNELRMTPNFDCIPIVILTTSSSPLDMVECKKMGVAAYFVKPIEYEDCKRLVETIYGFYFEFNALTTMQE